ncbi:conserved domain protein [Burkholderia pseudomallei 576]|nr:conserved domain protein [Burkholderia pseudomallei 576]
MPGFAVSVPLEGIDALAAEFGGKRPARARQRSTPRPQASDGDRRSARQAPALLRARRSVVLRAAHRCVMTTTPRFSPRLFFYRAFIVI